MFKRLLLGASGSVHSSKFNVESEDCSLQIDICPTYDSVLNSIINEYDIEPEVELDELSNIETDIVQYLAGFISKKVGIFEKCAKCSTAVLTQNTDNKICKFISYKSNGYLFHPNDNAIFIAMKCEQVFKMFEQCESLFKQNLLQKMIVIVMRKILANVHCFKDLDR